MKKQSIDNGELLREFPPFQIGDNLTGGYRLPCTNHSRARNNFYVVLNGFMPAYVCDLSVDEVREHYPDVTLGDFFHEGIQEWIMRLYQVEVNPLPYLREVYTEYNFKFVEKGVATPDVPLPASGATILVFRDGGMAAMMDEDIIASDEMTNKTLNSAENLKLAETFIYQHLKLML